MRYQVSETIRDDPRRYREISDPILNLEYRRDSLGSIFDGLGIGETNRDQPILTETKKAASKAIKAASKAIKAASKAIKAASKAIKAASKAKKAASKAKKAASKAMKKADTCQDLAILGETNSTLARLIVPCRDQKYFGDTKLKESRVVSFGLGSFWSRYRSTDTRPDH